MSDLEERGYLDESRDNTDPYLEDVMKNVNKVQYEELTPEQIQAARQRRARSIASFNKDDIEVPENHPFATKKELSADEEELIKRRLEVRRGLPLQDLNGRRGFPEDEELSAK